MAHRLQVRHVFVAVTVGERRRQVEVVLVREAAHRSRLARTHSGRPRISPVTTPSITSGVGGQGVIGVDLLGDRFDLESRGRRRDDDPVPHLAVDPQQLPHLRPQFGRVSSAEQRRTEIEELGVRLVGEGRFGGTQYLGVVLLDSTPRRPISRKSSASPGRIRGCGPRAGDRHR